MIEDNEGPTANKDNSGYSMMVDVSGSVGGSDHYWSSVNELVSLHGQQVQQYYFWDTSIELSTKKDLQKAISIRMGRGGTSPELVAKEVVKKNIKKLILITDGQVSDNSVKVCDQILAEYALEKSICYIISSGYGTLNMSVTCPFTRKCWNEVYEKEQLKEMKKLVQYTPEDYKILDTLEDITLNNFQANYEKIEGLIIALNMGKEGNIPLKNQLVVVKNRLVKELSKQQAGGDRTNISLLMREYLEKGDFLGAMEVAKNITNSYFSNSMSDSLQKRISHLINLCGNLKGQYNINQIKSNKMAWAKSAEEGKLDQTVQLQNLSKNLIECPIILDEDVPQILVDQCQPILLGFDKGIVDDIAACPLRILNYPDVKAKLKSRLSNFMGVKFSDKFMKNPFTQNKLLGAIPLGTHFSHVQVGNYTIAKMMTGGKILGNPNLFYAAIWHIIRQEQIEYLKDIKKNVTEHLIYRFKNSKTFMSLSGLAQFVTTEVTTDIAAWYCVNSGFLNQPTDRDTFRFHAFNILPLLQIVEELGYPIDKGVISHYHRTKALLTSLSFYKKLQNSQKKDFKESLHCLIQNCVEIEREKVGDDILERETFVGFIPIDGNTSEENRNKIFNKLPNNLKKLSLKEIIYIGKSLDAQKSAADYKIQYDFICPEVPEAKVAWSYGLNQYEEDKAEICVRTFRPYCQYQEAQWEQYYEKFYKVPISSVFKGRRYFEGFLAKHKRMPTKDELLIFYYNRYILSGKAETLPYLAEKWASQLIEQYQKALENFGYDIGEAIEILESGKDRARRMEMQAWSE